MTPPRAVDRRLSHGRPRRYISQVEPPEITYPCAWRFQIIGTDAEQVRTGVAAVVGNRAYELTPSRRSAKGTYASLRLELEVSDEADRNAIFGALGGIECVKVVV